MLVTLIPMFDENMAVGAYSLFTQKGNLFLNPSIMGTGQNDGASRINGLEVIQSMGIDTLSSDKLIFVPVNNISVFADIDSQCNAPHERLTLLMNNTIQPADIYINRLKELKEKGYKLAIRKLPVSRFEEYKEILKLMDYILFDEKKIAIDKAKIYFDMLYPDIKLCAGNVGNMERFEELKASGGYSLYEGDFYRIPVTKGDNKVAPIKANYIQLLNMVNDDNFELTKAADIIGRDTALTILLLKMVNRMAINSEITTIRYAAAMLGQKELKKWINTAVVKTMYSDKPNEITRLSLIRAKFAENLSGIFGMKSFAQELFLMGLFSVLDIIMEESMEEALKSIKVSSYVSEALISHTGKFAQILDFMECYEKAYWNEVLRVMTLKNIEIDPVYEAYLGALQWYRDLTAE